MSVRFLTMRSTLDGSIFPFSPGTSSILVPLEKNSGAPHSSVSTCATSVQRMEGYDWHNDASESEFAAVPLKTKNTSQLVSKTSRTRLEASSVQRSSP